MTLIPVWSGPPGPTRQIAIRLTDATAPLTGIIIAPEGSAFILNRIMTGGASTMTNAIVTLIVLRIPPAPGSVPPVMRPALIGIIIATALPLLTPLVNIQPEAVLETQIMTLAPVRAATAVMAVATPTRGRLTGIAQAAVVLIIAVLMILTALHLAPAV